MSDLAIVTDNTASIPEPMLKELNIHGVADYIHRGKEVLPDLVTIQRDEFLRWLPAASTLPTTASPGPGDYLDMPRTLIARGVGSILSIHMSSKASGAYQAAVVAQSMLREEAPEIRLEVVDTQNASLCHGGTVFLSGERVSYPCKQSSLWCGMASRKSFRSVA